MAVSAKDSKILEQKDLISQLNTTIAAQTELIQSLKKDHEADREQIQNLLAQVDYLTKKLFGTSSEKMKDVEGQLHLFDEAEQEADIDLKAPVIKVPEHTRKKKRTLEELFKGVPSRDEIISLPEDERVCDECGAALEPIGKEFVRHEFRFTPAKGEVVNIYRETYKCPACSTADAKIYYTLDGTNPTNASTEYAAPFSLDATATVKAKAYKGKDASAVATMQFVAIPTVANIAELTQLADGTEFVFGGEAVVTAAPTAKHLYLKDATGVTFAYDVAGGFTFEPGQHITAGWQGKVSFYKGLFEVVPTTALTVVEGVKDELTYDEVTPADVTLELSLIHI